MLSMKGPFRVTYSGQGPWVSPAEVTPHKGLPPSRGPRPGTAEATGLGPALCTQGGSGEQ